MMLCYFAAEDDFHYLFISFFLRLPPTFFMPFAMPPLLFIYLFSFSPLELSYIRPLPLFYATMLRHIFAD